MRTCADPKPSSTATHPRPPLPLRLARLDRHDALPPRALVSGKVRALSLFPALPPVLAHPPLGSEPVLPFLFPTIKGGILMSTLVSARPYSMTQGFFECPTPCAQSLMSALCLRRQNLVGLARPPLPTSFGFKVRASPALPCPPLTAFGISLLGLIPCPPGVVSDMPNRTVNNG